MATLTTGIKQSLNLGSHLPAAERIVIQKVVEYIDRPVQVFVDREVPVIKEVIERIEVPVEKIVEVEKQVFVDRIVEVEKIVTKEIEKIIEIPSMSIRTIVVKDKLAIVITAMIALVCGVIIGRI
jgi:glutamate synthase domain-containing protein 1